MKKLKFAGLTKQEEETMGIDKENIDINLYGLYSIVNSELMFVHKTKLIA